MKTTAPAPQSPSFEARPWGTFTVLDQGDSYKVKRIDVLPGKRLSYQRHLHREEHWVVVNGTATVVLEGHDCQVPSGLTIDIPREANHRIENQSDQPLVLIEIQRGHYLGEDDIIRVQDDFGRAS